MSTVTFRFDYAKFLIQCEGDRWSTIYGALNTLSHERKYSTEWLKSHKVNRLWYNAQSGMETWSIDIWGEWAGLVMLLPPHWLDYLKRVDVRATVWDATKDTILDLGQHLQRNVTSHNVNVFSTKPATKRLGRDRGGVGFAIGSHKSDLRITCYKRTGEPVAQEFQCTGAMLTRLVTEAKAATSASKLTASAWTSLQWRIEKAGNKRLEQVLERGGVGTYWPLVGTSDLPVLPPTQAAFIAGLQDAIDDHDTTQHPEEDADLGDEPPV